MKKKSNFFIRIKKKIFDFFQDEIGGSMIESGLLIALSLILFLILIGIVGNIYGWIEIKFNEVLTFFDPIDKL
jgi:Flp pilus assembly pilin Flp